MNATNSAVGLLAELEGVVQGHRDGHGFVHPATGGAPIFLPVQEMRSVLHRDRVLIRVSNLDRKGRPEAKILDILERPKIPIMGRLLYEAGAWVIAPEDKRYSQDILIPKNATANAVAGQVVAVELTTPASMHSQPVGRVTEVLGEIDDPGLEIEIAVRKYQVPNVFSAEALREAGDLPDQVRAIDRRNRIDLTDIPLVTIDGEDARDFDDAVYCEPLNEQDGLAASQWRLLVAIADVSHYVKPDTALDADAGERSTSVYFPRRVIPMLPEKLSNGLCSLKPDVVRHSLVCDMVVDAEGEVQAYQFYPAVIRSHARLTYTEVAALLSSPVVRAGDERPALLPHLLNLHEVYVALLRARRRRGAVDFESTETQIVCDESGRIQKILPRVRTEAHRLIEETMLAANVCAAHFIAQADHPALYRVHLGPTPEKRVALQDFLRTMGISVVLSEKPTTAEFQAIAQATQGRPDAQVIHTMLLRSMQQAVYTPMNEGHFGLAYDAYAHFTSPIRRYPDLMVHRVIKALLKGQRHRLVAPHGGRRSGQQAETNAWSDAGVQCSAHERRADEASRDVEAWLKCRYMREHLGEEFTGTVTAVAAFGIFVTLEALYVEGLVHITELGGEYFRYDEVRHELRGERTGIRYQIGSRIRVQVSRVDLDGRRVDFRMVRETDPAELADRPKRTRAGGRDPVAELASVRAADQEHKKATKAAKGKGSAKPGRPSSSGEAAPVRRRASESGVTPARPKPAKSKAAPRKLGKS